MTESTLETFEVTDSEIDQIDPKQIALVVGGAAVLAATIVVGRKVVKTLRTKYRLVKVEDIDES